MFVWKIPIDELALVTCIQRRAACAINVLLVAVLASGHVLADASVPIQQAIISCHFIFLIFVDCLLSTAISKSDGYTFLSSLGAHSFLRCFFWPRSKQQARWRLWTKVHPWVPWQIMSMQQLHIHADSRSSTTPVGNM